MQDMRLRVSKFRLLHVPPPLCSRDVIMCFCFPGCYYHIPWLSAFLLLPANHPPVVNHIKLQSVHWLTHIVNILLTRYCKLFASSFSMASEDQLTPDYWTLDYSGFKPLWFTLQGFWHFFLPVWSVGKYKFLETAVNSVCLLPELHPYKQCVMPLNIVSPCNCL